MDRFLGKRLDGRYEIQEVIGIGGMAVVYKALDIQDNRIVAVKILKEEFGTNSEFLRRFQNESKVIAVLSHPNIVKVYDVSFGDNFQYIVMEYIDGITLKEYIERKQNIPWKDALYFTVQILRALQHAHDKGIVHRDVKPQNIMLLRDGTIKVTDFGIARFSRSDERTITDKAIGSVHYISPEQAKGGPIDEKADLYSVGVLMYEMLTGCLPFDGDNAVSVAIMQLQDEPTHPREIDSSIPLGLEQITMRAMRKNPEHRYHSDAEMLRDLEEFKRNPEVDFGYDDNCVDAESADAYSGGALYSSEDDLPVPERPDEYYDDRQPYYDESQEEPKRKNSVLLILAGVAAAVVIIAAAVAAWFVFNKDEAGEFECPDLIGMTIDEARAAYSNLVIVENGRGYSDEYDYNIIIDQDIKVGKVIKDGTKILVKVSGGKNMADVPDVYGEYYEEAKKKIEASGLIPVIKEKNDESVEINCVISTDPPRNTQVDTGSEVIIYVSLGKEMKFNTVVDVTKLAQADAKAKLEALGFVVTVKEKDSDQVQKGYVVSQSVAKGTSYGVGQEIIIYVSTGKAPVEYEFEVSVTKPSDFSTDTYSITVLCGGDRTELANHPENVVDKTETVKKDIDEYTFKFTTEKSQEEIYVYIVVGDKWAIYQTYVVTNGSVSSPRDYPNWQKDLA